MHTYTFKLRLCPIAYIHVCTHMVGGRRVVGSIWCVDAGEPRSRPTRDANSASPIVVERPWT